MAKLMKPKKKGAVPTLEEASNNLITPEYGANSNPVERVSPEPVPAPATTPTHELKPLNFKVPPEFKKQYKQFALDNDMSLVQILKESFKLIKEVKK